MSKILVVEPHKILQRAIAVSFFPDHQVQITETVPGVSALEQGYDVVVIDAGALREKNTLGDLNRRVQTWQIPTIWLEDAVSGVAPAREKLVVLRKPIAKHDLVTALSQCQGIPSTLNVLASSNEPEKTAGPIDVRNKAKLPLDSERKTARIIELVDVVEEGHVRRRDRRSERKKK